MFDTMKIAKRIRESRIGKNMTQMQLADAMGVSYQAVSNWERGNSMPDISKLEDLCKALDLSVSQLLGMEEPQTAAVEKLVTEPEPELTAEELVEIVPALPPALVKQQAKKQKLNLAMLTEIAPFLDEDFLEEVLEDVEVDSLLVLQSLAPYLDEDVLDKLVRRAPKEDFNGIAALAPFLDEDTLDYLVKRCQNVPQDWAFVDSLAPFLDEDTVDWMVKHWGGEMSGKMLESLAPFMEEDTLDALADIRIAQGDVRSLSGLYPFMEEETLRKIAKNLMQAGELDGLKKISVFL